jgi:hypothetical protein
MSKQAWIGLSLRERNLILDALSELRKSRDKQKGSIDRLTAKLVHSSPHPEITIVVRGGQVQEARGNPFPIRVCDYDGQGDDDLLDVDDCGQRCNIWWERPSVRKTAYA